MKKQVISIGQLLLTALIWGVAFVAQSVGMEYIGPLTFNSVRLLIGGLFLLPMIFMFRKVKNVKTEESEQEAEKLVNDEEGMKQQNKMYRKNTLLGGIFCGILLATASSLQQFGIVYTTVGKAGFITALYIVIVPILGIFMKKKAGPIVWLSSMIALAGFYLLSVSGQSSINKGDILLLIGAVLFSFHIMVIDHFSPKGDAVVISAVQLLVSGVICAVGMFLFENPQLDRILDASVPILYAGVMSCGIAYTLQIVGQKNVEPTVASLILSLESVFSVLAGWLILGEKLSTRETIGCILVFGAVLLAQMPQKKEKKIPFSDTVQTN